MNLSRTGRRTIVVITTAGAVLAGAFVPIASAVETIPTKLELSVLDPGIDEGFVAGRIISPERACTQGRALEALALRGPSSGSTRSLRNGTFNIGLGDSQSIVSSGGFEVSARAKGVGSGDRRVVCRADTANVRYIVGALNQFDFDYSNGAFSGVLGPVNSPCAAPYRGIQVSSQPSGGVLGYTSTDVNGAFSLASANPPAGIYRAMASQTFGSAQRTKASGDLNVTNCEQVFVQTQVP